MAELATPPVDTTEPIRPAATDAPVTEPTGWMSDTGEFRDGAPETIQSLLEKKKWTTVEQMAQAYSELEKFKGGGNHLTIPEAEDAEGWADIYQALGRPETDDAYNYEAGEGVQLDDALVGEFKKFAHGLGFSQKQFKEVVDFQLDAVSAQQEVYEQQLREKAEADDAILRQAYGINYDQAMKDADIVAEKHALREELESEGVYGIPVVKKLLNLIANMEAEDTIKTSQHQPEQKSPAQKLAEIKASPAFMDKFHPDHKKLMQEYMNLNMLIANSGLGQSGR